VNLKNYERSRPSLEIREKTITWAKLEKHAKKQVGRRKVSQAIYSREDNVAEAVVANDDWYFRLKRIASKKKGC